MPFKFRGAKGKKAASATADEVVKDVAEESKKLMKADDEKDDYDPDEPPDRPPPPPPATEPGQTPRAPLAVPTPTDTVVKVNNRQLQQSPELQLILPSRMCC